MIEDISVGQALVGYPKLHFIIEIMDNPQAGKHYHKKHWDITDLSSENTVM